MRQDRRGEWATIGALAAGLNGGEQWSWPVRSAIVPACAAGDDWWERSSRRTVQDTRHGDGGGKVESEENREGLSAADAASSVRMPLLSTQIAQLREQLVQHEQRIGRLEAELAAAHEGGGQLQAETGA